MFSRIVVTLTALLLLQACGNLPQPFRPLPGSSGSILTNPRGAGIGVLAPSGVDTETSNQIAQVIAANLQSQDIPSDLVERVGVLGFTLEGNLRDATFGAAGTSLVFDWRLLNRSGEVTQRFDQSTTVNADDWRLKSAPALEQIANDISGQLISMFARPPMSPAMEQPQSRWEGLTVSIQKPRNAPGDGAQALGRALANRLSMEGFAPAETRPDIVFGVLVEVSPYDSSQEDVAIVWQVMTADEALLGEVRLDNRIPRGTLDEAWGLAAEAIVDAALPGLLEIIAARFDQTR